MDIKLFDLSVVCDRDAINNSYKIVMANLEKNKKLIVIIKCQTVFMIVPSLYTIVGMSTTHELQSNQSKFLQKFFFPSMKS